MTKGTRLLIMVIILMAVVFGMIQCAQKTVQRKKAHHEQGRAPIPTRYFAAAGVGSGMGT
jgi:uncharacterized alpha/beta hydrolase family protein